MKLLSQTLSVLLMVLFLQGCQLGQDDEEDDGTVEIEYLTTNDTFGSIVSNSNEYKLILQADNNIATLEDNISEINIKGDENTITIDSDTLINSISINGDENTIEVTDGAELTVTDLTIIGNANEIRVFDIVNTPVISSSPELADNLVCETNPSASVCN